MTNETPVTIHRNERVIAFMALAIVGVSLIAFFVILIAGGFGVRDFRVGLWPTVFAIPYLGFPIAFLLVLTLLIVSLRRRSRDAKAQLEAQQSSTKSKARR